MQLNTAISLLFTLGGILGFLAMLIHSFFYENFSFDKNSKDWVRKNQFKIHRTLFIFLAGSLLAYFLEYTLVHVLHAYSYTNLPLTILDIPIVIPLGWVITFYGLYVISNDLLLLVNRDQINYQIKIVGLNFVIALIFGLSIETLARISGFWIFYFDATELFGIPIIVTLAWGFSVAIFTIGLVLYDKYSRYWIFILVLVHLLNTMVAMILLSLV